MYDPPSDVLAYVATQVAAGYATTAEIREAALEIYGDADDDAARAALATAVDRALDDAVAAHAKAQATWSTPTDNDRLAAAFRRLEARDVLCAENFSCCQTCAGGELMDRIAADRGTGRRWRAYAYFHQQDTEAAAEGRGLCLAYGRVVDDGGLEADVAVGEEVAAALRAEGLRVAWDGRAERRLEVPMTWRRCRADADVGRSRRPFWRRLFGRR
jgi:hypothetical protein